jgi:hypothetical protein
VRNERSPQAGAGRMGAEPEGRELEPRHPRAGPEAARREVPERVSADRRPAWRRGARAGRHTHLVKRREATSASPSSSPSSSRPSSSPSFSQPCCISPARWVTRLGSGHNDRTHCLDTKRQCVFQLKIKNRFGNRSRWTPSAHVHRRDRVRDRRPSTTKLQARAISHDVQEIRIKKGLSMSRIVRRIRCARCRAFDVESRRGACRKRRHRPENFCS